MNEQKQAEAPKEKTAQEILRDYQQLVLQLGQTQYQIDALTSDKELLVRSMKRVNLEYSTAQAKQKRDDAEKQLKEAEAAANKVVDINKASEAKQESETKNNA